MHYHCVEGRRGLEGYSTMMINVAEVVCTMVDDVAFCQA